MKGTVLYGSRNIRFEERDAPKIVHPTDAIIRIEATCARGSDLIATAMLYAPRTQKPGATFAYR
jgi:threonine dehydrogenase-like Zn-dependent dehydrogenase